MSFWSGFFDRIPSLKRARDAEQECTREMMPQGVQQWEIDSCRSYKTLGNPEGLEGINPFAMHRNLAAEKYLDELNFLKYEAEQREKRKEKLRNPKSIYLRKKK